MTHNWLRRLVPRSWTADEALLAVDLLRQAVAAIWEVHGEEMAEALGSELEYRDHLDRYVDLDDERDLDIDDDVPF
jgi:hypothetical protein